MKRIFPLISILTPVLVWSMPTAAQMLVDAPSVNVRDQAVLDGTVRVRAFSDGPGFVVVHKDDGDGGLGPVIGTHAVAPGWNFGTKVAIDPADATPTMFAMLLTGDKEPVAMDGVVAKEFKVDVIDARDQFVSDGAVTVRSVIAQVDSWLVIHADNGEGSFGAVLGVTPVAAGTTTDVSVALDGDVTDTLWPMLHVDTGVAGVYEFGSVEDADVPVAFGRRIAVARFSTVPSMRVENQTVDDTVVVASVLAEADSFIVIHAEVDGGFGPVAGFAPVSAGLTTDVTVEVDATMVTSRLWPMLHVDTGTAGEYEFGAVEGADAPVVVNDSVLTFPINAAPSMILEDQPVTVAMMGIEPHIFIKEALIDAPGWVAIHSSVDGSPGPVIGVASIVPGRTTRLLVEIDGTAAGQQVFPMLHYDTGVVGEYEFGAVDGADGPVAVSGNVVVAPMALTDGDGM